MPLATSGSTAIARSLAWKRSDATVRVIAGAVRGRPLVGPVGARTRPTSDKVKGALFSMLETLLATRRPGFEPGPAEGVPGDPAIWNGLNVADFYAGTGALGIEALSRGAAWCDFFEIDPAARRVIDRNVQATSMDDRTRVVGLDVRKVGAIDRREAFHLPYGVVLMDPPYADPTVSTAVSRVANRALLEANALVAIEHSRYLMLNASYEPDERSEGEPETPMRLVQVRERRHGDTVLSIYRWVRAANRGDVDADHGDLPG